MAYIPHTCVCMHKIFELRFTTMFFWNAQPSTSFNTLNPLVGLTCYNPMFGGSHSLCILGAKVIDSTQNRFFFLLRFLRGIAAVLPWAGSSHGPGPPGFETDLKNDEWI